MLKPKLRNLLSNSQIIQKNKKIKKLVNNPDLFFYDYFKKKLKNSSTLISSSAIQISNISNSIYHSNIIKHRNINYKYDTKEICLKIIEELSLNTFLIFCHLENKNGEFKIICNVDQLGKIHNFLKDFEFNNLRIFSSQNKALSLQRTSIEYAFYDEETVYLNNIITLEPWFKNNNQIFTYNNNHLLTHLDKRYLNKTVYSSHPNVLQGEYKTPYLEEILDLKYNSFNYYNFPIDIVITWVDGKCQNWKNKKQQFNKPTYNSQDNSIERYDDIDEIKYCLRSIEKNLKFARNIFLVTDDQKPWWLDETNSKIKVIDHKEIIESQYLPTFNSHVIESFLHKIPGLSEHFIYMNDDCFIWSPLEINNFFLPNGISISKFEIYKNVYGNRPDITSPAWKNAAINCNNVLKKLNLAPGASYHAHTPFALKKSILEKLESKFKDEYALFRPNRLRGYNDLSTLSFLYHHYTIQNGGGVFTENFTSLTVNSSNKSALNSLKSNAQPYNYTYEYVCINDGGERKLRSTVIDILNQKFPEKADWEL